MQNELIYKPITAGLVSFQNEVPDFFVFVLFSGAPEVFSQKLLLNSND